MNKDWKQRLGQAMSREILERKWVNAEVRRRMPVDVIGDLGQYKTLSNKKLVAPAVEVDRAIHDLLKAAKSLKLAGLYHPNASDEATLASATKYHRMTDELLQEAIDTFDAECKCGILRRTCEYHKIELD